LAAHFSSELAHACGLIAFDGRLKLLRSDQGHAHHRRDIEPERMLAISRRIAAGVSRLLPPPIHLINSSVGGVCHYCTRLARYLFAIVIGLDRAGRQPCRHPPFGAFDQFLDERGYCMTMVARKPAGFRRVPT
jgi:hypothetical protein